MGRERVVLEPNRGQELQPAGRQHQRRHGRGDRPRHELGEELAGRGVDRQPAPADGDGEDDDQEGTLERGEHLGEADSVADPLPPGQPRRAQRAVRGAERGEVPGRPAVPLKQKLLEVVRRDAVHERLVVEAAAPAAPVDPKRRVEVLRDRVGGKAADLLERRPPDDGAGPAPERGTVVVAPRLDDVEEHRLVVVVVLHVLDRVAVVELMRRLDVGEAVVLEMADDRLQHLRLGHVIRVEDEDQLAPRSRERGVDVPRLGVDVLLAGQIPRAEVGGEIGDPRPATVVEHPDLEVRVVEGGAPDQGRPQHLLVLVVGRDVDIHGGLPRRRDAIDRPQPPGREREPRQAQERVQLTREERERQRQPHPGHRRVDAPHEVARSEDQGERRDGARRPVTAGVHPPIIGGTANLLAQNEVTAKKLWPS